MVIRTDTISEEMVFDLFVDSLSRCFGISGNSSGDDLDTLDVSRSGNASNDTNGKRIVITSQERVHLNALSLRAQNNDWDGPMKVCCTPAFPQETGLEGADIEEHDVLARARRQASVSTGRRRFKSSGPISLLPSGSISKARTKSNKRKNDIFRTVSESDSKTSGNISFASRLLGDNSFATGAMLCFANPIVDEDEDSFTNREIIANEDDETITSTVIFDAKYEHIVEDQPPLALYSDFSVSPTMSIAQIFKSGSHKSIKSIQYSQQIHTSTQNTSIANNQVNRGKKADKTISLYSSSGDSTEDDDECQKLEEQREHYRTATAVADDEKETAIPSSKPEFSLAVNSSEEGQSSMKLATKSSLSTAALTPVCSSRSSTSAHSLSPQARRRKHSSNMIEKNLESIQTSSLPLV